MTNNSQGTPIEEGGYGAPAVEQEMGGADTKKFAHPREEEAFDAAGLSQDSPGGAEVPSADAEMDESNTEDPDAGRAFSSEPTPDAAGIPDGSGADLPDSKSPKDRDDDTFDAG